MTWISSLGFLFSFGVFLPVFMDYFKSSRETAACLGSVAIALTFFTGHFSTALISQFGCRITTVIGGVFCAMGLIASSFVENIFVLFFTYSFLFAVGCSCTFSVGMVVLSHYFKKRQSLATGVLTSGHGGGVLILGPTLEALRTVTGWQATWRIMAGVALFTCSLSVTFDPNVETDGVKGNLMKRDSSEDRKDENIITKIKSVLDFSVWKEPPVIVFICCVCVVEFGHFVPQIHLIRFSEDLGFSPKRASELLIYYGLCSAIGRLLAGFLCSHPRVNPFHVFQAAECIAGLSTVLVTLGTTYTTLIIYIVVYGLSDGFFFTTLSFLLLTVSPHKTAAVLGWEMMLTSLFLASGPALAGLLADKLGSYVIPFQLAGGITLTGALIPFTLLCFQRSGRATLRLPQDEGQPLLNELNHS